MRRWFQKEKIVQNWFNVEIYIIQYNITVSKLVPAESALNGVGLNYA